LALPGQAEEIFVRANQLGYHPEDVKLAIAFSASTMPDTFELVTADTQAAKFHGKTRVISGSKWGAFSNHVELDFSNVKTPGRFVVRLGETTSLPFTIGRQVYADLPDDLLEFMREQRCGYNPWLDSVCHPFDGRTAYGPQTNGSYLDARGGWHDAADLLKYLLTSSTATADLLLASELGPGNARRDPARIDRFNALGQPGHNGIPDILDEALWGLDWMLKLHPAPDQLYHQVADDRDHVGRRLPQNETVDYGWGQGSYRVVYFADGRPQGLREYQSQSTGVANLAGRYSAAMALAFQIWKHDPTRRPLADRCLQAGREVYELGRAKEGVQQGNSFRAPYRYEEGTWADDMEWGAAELFRATHDRRYLKDAIRYANLAASDSWMGKEETKHYEFYPFINMGHFRLYEFADLAFRKVLARYYREGIERCVRAGEKNPYGIGMPFIWCSNNLTVALVTQCLLYERMTEDTRFHDFAARQRDWLLGRNPWGYTMFTGIGSAWPKNPHLMTKELTGRAVPGGLVDGPVYERIFKSLKGVTITEPDPLAAFQGKAVYHDDSQDYSSNEPTMDGTASAILLWALCASGQK
jgi:hypothetical protein